MDKESKKPNPVIGVLVALYGLFLLYGIGSSMMDRYTVAQLTQHMKTACVGRFLIDLPASMEHSYGQAFVNGLWISGQEETRQEFEARVLARQAEIDAEPNELGKRNMEKIEEYENNGFTGKIFIFGRQATKGTEHGKPVVWVDVKLEAYVHSHGRSFNFRTDGYDVDRTGNLRRLMDKLRLVPAKEIPTAAGFCFGLGMFVDPLPADFSEGVVLFAGFPDHPDLAMAFNMRAGTEPDKEGRLERDTAVDAAMPAWQRALMNKLRKGRRAINGIDGEEVAEKWTELNFVHTFAFNWEVSGTRDDVFLPFMHLEMSTGHPVNAGARPGIGFLGEDALIELWDRISSSIRVRPTSATLPARLDAPPPPDLGDTTSAGDVCPETGWWQCQDGGYDASVAGGRRQFLKRGQRMPQALLLHPQTLWEKLRGVQSSYRLANPTVWTLVDRRSEARTTAS
ncbi:MULTISPECIES: T6SS immunity protein Tli4 family protein [unclassified Massilia]|uniref:T6SS immunity protein Tli4 family protein n=1 Tax=unclassified Massilia TaxID=2609279 RepID=UPI000A3EA094|nr:MULTISPECIES: T6SS immunity protein Tli4 family protein [unclassified Massilia]